MNKTLKLLAFAFGLITITNRVFGMELKEFAASQADSIKIELCQICNDLLIVDGPEYQLPNGLQLSPKAPKTITTECGHTFHIGCILNYILNVHGEFMPGKACPHCGDKDSMQDIYDLFVQPLMESEIFIDTMENFTS